MPGEDGGGLVQLRTAVTPEEWYLALGSRLQRYAVQKFGIPADDAEGLVHDVFLSFLTPRKPIRDARAWFFGAVSHACRDYLRKQGRVVTGEELPEGSAEPPHVIRIAAREMLRALPPVEREMLWMQFAEGHTVREIATRVGRSVSWTEKRLRQARRKAAEMLGDDDETNLRPIGIRAPRADTFWSAAAAAAAFPHHSPKLRMIRPHVRPLRGISLPRTPPGPAVLSAHGRAARQVPGQLSGAHGLLQIAAGAA
jgi:RNA polymerase sigma factor (sigma-70 family)